MCAKNQYLLVLLSLLLAGLLAALSVSAAISAPSSSVSGRMGAEAQVSPVQSPTDADRYLPVAAFNTRHNQFLVVWHNHWSGSRDIYAQRLDLNGSKVGPWFCISTGAGDRVQPAVAYNATNDEYMVLFMQDVSAAKDGSQYNIVGQRVAWNGVLNGGAFTIGTYPNVSFWSPRLAWNSTWNEYMAVWSTLDTTSHLATGIGMVILAPDGTIPYGTILTSDGYPTSPDLVYDSIHKNYLVVWQRLSASGKQVIIGDLRDDNGNRARPDVFGIFGSTTNSSYYPRVTYSNGFYGVVFEYEIAANDHDIYLALVWYDGSTIIPLPVENTNTHDTHADIAGNPAALEYFSPFSGPMPSAPRFGCAR